MSHSRPLSPINSSLPSSPVNLGVPQLEDFALEKEIGIGSYSRVYRALHFPSNKKYAIKVLQKARVLRENKVNEVKMEKHILQLLNHPFIIRLFCTFQDKENLCIPMSNLS